MVATRGSRHQPASPPPGRRARAAMNPYGHCLTLALAMAAFLMPTPVQGGGNIEWLNDTGDIINVFWDSRTFPIRYKLNENAALGLTLIVVKPEIDAAFAQWEDLPDDMLDFAWGGTTAVNTAAADGVNVLIFNPPIDPGNFVAAATCTTLTSEQIVTDASDGTPGNGLGFLRAGAVNVLLAPVGTYAPGTNIDCDITYEVFGTTFTADGTSGTQDIRGISVHEIGHWLSLSHTLFHEASLYPFPDVNPPGDGTGSTGTVHSDDISAAGHIYKDAGYDANTGTITGVISLNGLGAGGVHVSALRADNLDAVAARFSMSRFLDPLDAVDGADFLAQGTGFYRLDGLPPGDYYIYAEWLDGTDEPFNRLDWNHNLTTLQSRVADGDTADYAGSLGFLPQRFEFYNTLESAAGGDGTTAGSAVDNPDEATMISIAPGDVITGVDIAINLDPDTGKAVSQRENPTGISRHDVVNPATNLVSGVSQPADGTDDNFWLMRFPASELPAPPYNVIEGIWTKSGRSDQPYTGGLMLADPANANIIEPFIVFDPPRLVAGSANGRTGLAEQVDVRERFNVTVNQARDLLFVVKQPESSAIQIVDGYFIVGNISPLACSRNGVPCTINPDGSDDCSGPPSNVCIGGSGNTFSTLDNFQTFEPSGVMDIVYRVRTESAPAVLITGASPATLNQDDSSVLMTISGAGFRNGAQVDFLSPGIGGTKPSGVTVISTGFVSSSTLEVTVDVAANATPGLLDVQVRNPEVVIPNRARLMTLNAGADGDGDGYTDSGDCAAADPDLWALPGSIENTVVATVAAGGGVRFDWEAPADPGGTNPAYNVVRGDGAILNSSTGGDFGSCLFAGVASTTATDSSLPAPGQIQVYMFNTINGCGDSTYLTPAGDPLRDSNPGNC
ncbi:MAG: hypothetical protein E2P00_04890 [Acidobacteria bacterium]|nr:MAG: hypothetical protein E2P00_04890 [Acidobacteriota bacterium]